SCWCFMCYFELVHRMRDFVCFYFFFFKQKTAYEITRRDWSSDVCSSDLTCETPGSCAGGGRSMQFMRTAVLLAALTALFLIVGALLGGRGGMTIALIFAIGTNLYAYWNSDRMALAAVDAREVADEASAPELVGLVRGLSARAGLPMPRIFLVDSP